MKTPREKYQNDAQYYALVHCMIQQIEQCNFTPSEIREAAMLASILYEQRRIDKYYLVPTPGVIAAQRKIEYWVSEELSM